VRPAPVSQHYAPRFYLKRFACDLPERGHIWVYEKGHPPARRSINRTAMEEDLYAFTRQDGSHDNTSAEYALQRIDSAGAIAISRLETRGTLSSGERRALCVFISRMLRGTPAHRRGVMQSAGDMMPGFFAQHNDVWLRGMITQRLGTGVVADAVFERERQKLKMLRDNYLTQAPDHLFAHEVVRPSAIEDALFDMDWGMLVAHPGVQFLTCDNPVVYSRRTGLRDREHGLVLFPLSPNLCLQAMWRTDYRDQHVAPTPGQIRLINRYVVQNAYSHVFSHENSSNVASFVDKWSGSELGATQPG
jgi:hypothetical protein